MNVTLSYDEEFGELLDSLRSKYGEQIFEIEGIGSQLDLNKFSKEFFNTRVTADASIDANANVGDSTVVSYSVELTKPFEKLNSLYLLWKEMRRLYHTDVANKIIEMHISGDIYIHDLHSVNKPYSYARNTPLNIKLYNEETSTTMEGLFLGMMLHHDKVVTYDREYYDLCNDDIYVEDFDEVSNSKIWTKVKYVIKHKRHNKLLKFTLCGNPFELMVTEDHPMILKDGSIKDAKDVTTKDLLRSWCLSRETIVKIEVVEDSAFNDYVYDITTESGTFIVDSLVVHNCFNYDPYDIINKGLPMITKIKSVEPKHLYSFKSQLEQFIVIASNSTLGASGISTVFIAMSYYVKNILATMSDAHFTFKDETAVWTYVRETIASLIYTLNQPFRGGIQCVTESTEIYTPDGFKHYSDLTVGDLVCTFNINTHEFEFQPIQKMNVSKYSGTLDVYGKQHVTPNHKVLVNTSEDVYELIVSEDIEEFVTIPKIAFYDDNTFTVYYKNHYKSSMEYDGVVWCPTTAAGVVVFKNEDEIFISGNSSFTNVSIFDSNFLKDMSAMYIFPDGSTPDISIIQKLQRLYLEVMNENQRRTPITFPVTTACFSIDENKEFKDPDFVKEIIEYNKEFGFINLYSGKSTTLSSCCFDGYQEIFALVNDEWKYVRFSELHDNDEIFIMGVDDLVQAKLVKIDMGTDGHVMHIVRLVNDEQLVVTHDHIHPTSLGDKTTEQLSRSDSLILNTKFGKQNVKIESIDAYRSLERYVYCLEVINDAPYFTLANGILTHNCRLKSDMTSIGYSNSIGGSSPKIGSVGVTTLNLYRLAKRSSDVNDFKLKLAELVGVAARVNHARRTIIRKKTERGFAPLYTYEFISLDKQYSTCGVSGVYEALEALGEDLTSETGLNLAIEIVELINAENARYDKAFGFSHNTEQIPGESLSVKLADKDRLLGYNTEHDLYSNQFIPLTATADILERIRIQGALDSHFSGGSIAHLNFDKRIEDSEAVFNLLKEAVKQGIIYMAINYVLNECENGHMTVGKTECCTTCGGQLSNKFSRIVGFLSNVKNWNKVRREKDFPNRKFYSGDVL